MRERSAICLKLLDSSMGFPGLCRGITRPNFQLLGCLHCLKDGLWCQWGISLLWSLDDVRELALFYLGPASFFSFWLWLLLSLCNTWTFCPRFSVSLFFLCISLLFLIFLGVWNVLLVELIGAFPWIMASSLLSAKIVLASKTYSSG